MSAQSKATAPKPSKRRRRVSLKHAVIWGVIIAFSLSVLGGIIVLGTSLAH